MVAKPNEFHHALVYAFEFMRALINSDKKKRECSCPVHRDDHFEIKEEEINVRLVVKC